MQLMRFRLLIDRERCKGCALCIDACFRRALHLDGAMNARGHHYVEFEDRSRGCTGCRQCADVCPDAAIAIVKTQYEGQEDA